MLEAVENQNYHVFFDEPNNIDLYEHKDGSIYYGGFYKLLESD